VDGAQTPGSPLGWSIDADLARHARRPNEAGQQRDFGTATDEELFAKIDNELGAQ